MKKEITISIFEDELTSRFFPLAYFRPIYNLRTGIFSLKEKIFLSYKNINQGILCREYLSDYMKIKNNSLIVNDIKTDDVLFLNGRILADKHLAKTIPLKGEEEVFISNDTIVAIRAKGNLAKIIIKNYDGKIDSSLIKSLPKKNVNVRLIENLWDLIKFNGEEIENDAKHFKSFSTKNIDIHKSVHLLNKKQISIGRGTIIKPNVVIDAENGPVVIGENVTILPQSVIIGPAFIGNNSTVKVGTVIYKNSSIGAMCKVGGEIEGTIIHGYSNKQHDGFLGHAYIGAWVNLGADTINSDLKNNYGNVKVHIGGEPVDSKMQFVGSFIGDHTKTAINSVLNTGTVIGVSSNIFGFGFPPKFVPAFSWGAAGETFTTFDIEKAIIVAERMMLRRKIILTNEEKILFRKIFLLTKAERIKRGMPS